MFPSFFSYSFSSSLYAIPHGKKKSDFRMRDDGTTKKTRRVSVLRCCRFPNRSSCLSSKGKWQTSLWHMFWIAGQGPGKHITNSRRTGQCKFKIFEMYIVYVSETPKPKCTCTRKHFLDRKWPSFSTYQPNHNNKFSLGYFTPKRDRQFTENREKCVCFLENPILC